MLFGSKAGATSRVIPLKVRFLGVCEGSVTKPKVARRSLPSLLDAKDTPCSGPDAVYPPSVRVFLTLEVGPIISFVSQIGKLWHK